ncbi:MAG: helix-turn-helix transcriptional regulator [Anaerorhabdus sp.]|uniref:helix-turn-helix transcriptional regulator n=1 Tax=Anaerorhabdus sp. TaxID=1872524 RepID=UPI002B2136AD|nr:helix-turn-helix transcriptional regulator [Anaerorhabdus sp.]MEA4875864.1 helix-turn-helix transcriptional regulator [Anaerorhabdus sp.]
MEIGKMLKDARVNSGLTQEDVADKIRVTRQTMSNWENEKCYPDIINVIELSNLYGVSLDELLKGDEKMIQHLEQSTDTVNSNKKLIGAIGVNILLILIFIVFNGVIAQNQYLILLAMSIGVISTCVLFYQIIRKI